GTLRDRGDDRAARAHAEALIAHAPALDPLVRLHADEPPTTAAGAVVVVVRRGLPRAQPRAAARARGRRPVPGPGVVADAGAGVLVVVALRHARRRRGPAHGHRPVHEPAVPHGDAARTRG